MEDTSFEESFERLEEVVERLESGYDGEMGLDEALELYEEGVRLVEDCRERLDEAEHRLEVIEDGSD